jgi:hypothetical protein
VRFHGESAIISVLEKILQDLPDIPVPVSGKCINVFPVNDASVLDMHVNNMFPYGIVVFPRALFLLRGIPPYIIM